jgi:hypothetical protein
MTRATQAVIPTMVKGIAPAEPDVGIANISTPAALLKER